MSSFKPALVLAAISAIVSALIIITYNITYTDTSNTITDKQATAVISIYGGTEEDYYVYPYGRWKGALPTDTKVQKVIRGADGIYAIEVVVKGYKDGFDIMVGVKDSAVSGVSIVSTGEETPGLGTKTNSPAFLGQFVGIKDEAVVVKKTPSAEGEVQAVTSATRSSNGVAEAVNIALDAYDRIIEMQNSRMDGGEAQ